MGVFEWRDEGDLLPCRMAVGEGYCGDRFRLDLILAVASVISRNLE